MKTRLDFFIQSDPYWITVSDFSEWGLIENGKSTMEVMIPGWEKSVTLPFDKSKVNGFNSILLGINCEGDCNDAELVTLPDGIYKFTLIGTPNNFKKAKYFLKTDMIQSEIDDVFIDSVLKEDYELIESKLNKIEFLIKGAEAHTRKQSMRVAGSMFSKAGDLIADIKDCRYC